MKKTHPQIFISKSLKFRDGKEPRHGRRPQVFCRGDGGSAVVSPPGDRREERSDGA